MDDTMKRAFINQFFHDMQAHVLSRVADMPESWDGHELRQYVADKFAQECTMDRRDTFYRRRMRAYRNDVATSGGL